MGVILNDVEASIWTLRQPEMYYHAVVDFFL